ncbi:hypothetical protein DMB91_08750 [Campylobacter sp. MIT 97-5078]|uniref:hypothetical protein n=1 Tax=Campylobacter sp. MIT 97-5078 TaxID=1548153 RepID=UPI0011609812|nr:hypothetical protein [Campylobacter sp. MIT 97-5078]TQR22612.1 hypothetical protein DMB91_08750 [Campylobacter sp. MIT 97-5078]
MKKSLLSLALTFGLVGALNAQDVDVLALVTKGAVSDNSKGVKVLSLDEMKEVKGGWKIGSANWYAYTFIEMPIRNNINANKNPGSKQAIYSNAFCQNYGC